MEKAITDETILITIQMANNEIGTIQPIAEIGKIAKARKVTFHTDAVAAAGIIPINIKEIDVDLLSLAANQFNGPNGVGALYIRRGTGIWPLIEGGVQENRKRAGTENVVGIVGLGMAAEMARVEMPERLPKFQALRQKLIQGLKDRIPHLVFNGHPTQVLPHLVSVSVEFIEGEGLMLLMDEEGVCVATRSACASGSLRASHVLIGTGMDFAPGPGHPAHHLRPGQYRSRRGPPPGGHAEGSGDPAGNVAHLSEKRLQLIFPANSSLHKKAGLPPAFLFPKIVSNLIISSRHGSFILKDLA